jgi:LmbE family N-acetylglucosaminyl deacetylase
MTDHMTYSRRNGDGILTTANIAEVFPDWKGPGECWLFISPHDDDLVTGAGLTFQAGLIEGTKVHAAVVSDGRMGYCRIEQQHTIAKIRMAEAQRSFAILGLPAERLRFLRYPDGDLNSFRGRHFTTTGSYTEIEGAVGMQNTFTHLLRQIRPNRVFLPTSTDLHPDHKVTHEELLISLFHAQGGIWPELGEPIAEVPRVYEFAVYCDFPEPPNIRIDTPPALLETKLEAIRAYVSQEQIDAVVDIQRSVGPIEYLRELIFKLYSPRQYHPLFARSK